jgi:NADH-quinone oxidoreductase subunit J
MTLPAAAQLVLAIALAAAGCYLLLPKPRRRSVMGGTAALLAAAAVLGAWFHQAFGDPAADWPGNLLFVLFAAGALGFGAVLVVQRNPARGAIAFAFVILSTCGLFLLLAAPFLMAATVIVYAGAIVVTFLFVLMLSQVAGPSNENDRTREPLLGSLAGFAFVGLVLFTLHEARASVDPSAADPHDSRPPARLPAPVLTDAERQALGGVAARLAEADERLHGDLTAGRAELAEFLGRIEADLENVVGVYAGEPIDPQARRAAERDPTRVGSIRARVAGYRPDPQARAVLDRVAGVRRLSHQTFRKLEDGLAAQRPDVAAAKADLRKLREEVQLLRGAGELPARNVANLGLLIYADYLLAVELAGTLLLVATVGAVAISHRRGAA